MSKKCEFLPVHPEAFELHQKLNLIAHPKEQGWFSEVYKSNQSINRSDDGAKRSAITSIYFLEDFSCKPKWHRLKSNEIFVYLKGSPIKVHMLSENLRSVTIGDILDQSEKIDGYQVTIPKGITFAAEILRPKSYSLVACLVSPGYEANEFSFGDEKELVEKYPEHKNLIKRFS